MRAEAALEARFTPRGRQKQTREPRAARGGVIAGAAQRVAAGCRAW
ncbi:MAG TPA: hypothetical protein VKF35_12165 [Hyphomicrobiaceae bacterium]|nr:hypothetical protein [Hyphomicrobiaceae bacterium]